MVKSMTSSRGGLESYRLGLALSAQGPLGGARVDAGGREFSLWPSAKNAGNIGKHLLDMENLKDISFEYKYGICVQTIFVERILSILSRW